MRFIVIHYAFYRHIVFFLSLQMALEAWAHNYVPMFVTSNSRFARSYAKAILGFLHDWYNVGYWESARFRPFTFQPAPLRCTPFASRFCASFFQSEKGDPDKPVYILEIGGGHGRFTYLVLRHLLRQSVRSSICSSGSGCL